MGLRIVSKTVLRNEYSRCFYLYFYRDMFSAYLMGITKWIVQNIKRICYFYNIHPKWPLFGGMSPSPLVSMTLILPSTARHSSYLPLPDTHLTFHCQTLILPSIARHSSYLPLPDTHLTFHCQTLILPSTARHSSYLPLLDTHLTFHC
jgi:hypothetical protein